MHGHIVDISADEFNQLDSTRSAEAYLDDADKSVHALVTILLTLVNDNSFGPCLAVGWGLWKAIILWPMQFIGSAKSWDLQLAPDL